MSELSHCDRTQRAALTAVWQSSTIIIIIVVILIHLSPPPEIRNSELNSTPYVELVPHTENAILVMDKGKDEGTCFPHKYPAGKCPT